MKQVLLERSIEIPQSDSWHKDLLNLSASMGIISEKLSDELYAYLTFRHFFVHAYGFMLDEDQLEDLLLTFRMFGQSFYQELKIIVVPDKVPRFVIKRQSRIFSAFLN